MRQPDGEMAVKRAAGQHPQSGSPDVFEKLQLCASPMVSQP
jgi:hypothetical protein